MNKQIKASRQGVAIDGPVIRSTINTGNTIVLPKPPTPRQLREPLDDFVGSVDEIDELCEKLGQGGQVRKFGINGMGGIGKTELALVIADKLKDDYPDAQLFVKLEGTSEKPVPPEQALEKCIRAFEGLEVALPQDVDELSSYYRSLLKGKQVLVLLDNAADLAQIQPLKPPKGCLLLVTSRHPIALPGLVPKRLDVLTKEDARTLFWSAARPRNITEEIADQICALCGYLPLAIRAAGSLLAVTEDLDEAEYVEQLRIERTRLEAIGEEGVDIGVRASFNLSYTRLSEEAKRVFRTLMVFPGSFNSRAEETICQDADHKYLSDLVKLSLALFEPKEERYRLHDLVRIFASTHITDTELMVTQERHAEHFLHVLFESREFFQNGGEVAKIGLAGFDREWSNIQVGWEWANLFESTNHRALELCSKYPDAIGCIETIRLHPRERIKWREKGLSAAQKLGWKDAQSWHLANLGGACLNLGEYKRALEFFDRQLTIARENKDFRIEGHALNSLGIVYEKLEEFDRSVEFHQQSLTIKRKIKDERGEAISLLGIGNAHISRGFPWRAIKPLEQSLVILRKRGDHQAESGALLSLGTAYSRIGKIKLSAEYYQKSLAISHEIGDSWSESLALWNLSLLVEREYAIKFAETALDLADQIEAPWAAEVREQLEEWRRDGGEANE